MLVTTLMIFLIPWEGKDRTGNLGKERAKIRDNPCRNRIIKVIRKGSGKNL